MRAPQLGHSKRKRRSGTNGWSKPISVTLPAAKPRLWRAVGLAGVNQPLPTRRIKYLAPKDASYVDGTVGASVTLALYGPKSRDLYKWKLGNPTVTKPYHSVKHSQGRHRG